MDEIHYIVETKVEVAIKESAGLWKSCLERNTHDLLVTSPGDKSDKTLETIQTKYGGLK